MILNNNIIHDFKISTTLKITLTSINIKDPEHNVGVYQYCDDLGLSDQNRVWENLLWIILMKIRARKERKKNCSLGAYEMLQANGWLCYVDTKLPNLLC